MLKIPKFGFYECLLLAPYPAPSKKTKLPLKRPSSPAPGQFLGIFTGSGFLNNILMATAPSKKARLPNTANFNHQS